MKRQGSICWRFCKSALIDAFGRLSVFISAALIEFCMLLQKHFKNLYTFFITPQIGSRMGVDEGTEQEGRYRFLPTPRFTQPNFFVSGYLLIIMKLGICVLCINTQEGFFYFMIFVLVSVLQFFIGLRTWKKFTQMRDKFFRSCYDYAYVSEMAQHNFNFHIFLRLFWFLWGLANFFLVKSIRVSARPWKPQKPQKGHIF